MPIKKEKQLLTLDEIFDTIVSDTNTKSVDRRAISIRDIFHNSGMDFDGDICSCFDISRQMFNKECENPKIDNISIKKNLVSVCFSDATIVIISRDTYDEYSLSFKDYTKDEFIRLFAIEVY